MSTLINPNIKDAQELWSFTKDVTLVKSSKKASMARKGLRTLITDVAATPIDYIKHPNKEVIAVAQFIANIEPSYLNSTGQAVELVHLRTNINLTDDDIEFICEKLEDIVKPYITVSSTGKPTSKKFTVKSSLSKKKLIHRAIKHLLVGSEVFKDPMAYHVVKEHSLFMDNIKESYAYLIGLAISTGYNSVNEMMDDLCIQFIDQTETINKSGQVTFYDGSIRVENL